MNAFSLSTSDVLALDAERIGELPLDELADLHCHVACITDADDPDAVLALFDLLNDYALGRCECGAPLARPDATECGGCTEVF